MLPTTNRDFGREAHVRKRFELVGWSIFLGCSGLFLVSTSLANDAWGIAASAAFLVGCVVFLVPLVLDRE